MTMARQNFGSGLEKDGPPRQGEKGGKGGTIKKAGRSMRPGEKGNNAETAKDKNTKDSD
jgi:hypothetical protein